MRHLSAFSRFAALFGCAVALGGCSDGGQASAAGGGSGSVNLSGTGGAGEPDGGVASAGGVCDGIAGHAGSANGGSTAMGGGETGGGATGGNTTGGNATGGSATAGSSVGGTSAGSAGTGGGGSGGQAAASNGCIVPLYTDPGDSTWTTIVQAKLAHPSVDVVAIVNPSNGPGNGVDKSYTSGIAKVVAAGIVPIGYVSTNYTKRGQTAVNADTDTWHASYPAVEGIFFDEQSVTPGDEAFYAAVAAHAKAQSLTLTVGNPGTAVPNSFLTALDVMLSYESDGTPTLNSLKPYASHREQFGIIPYAASFDAAYVKAATQSVRYVYLTNDDLPNPWDTLPSYFDALLGALTAAP